MLVNQRYPGLKGASSVHLIASTDPRLSYPIWSQVLSPYQRDATWETSPH